MDPISIAVAGFFAVLVAAVLVIGLIVRWGFKVELEKQRCAEQAVREGRPQL